VNKAGFGKWADADPRLKINQIINYCFAFVLYSLRLFKVKTEGQTIYRKPHCKVAKLNSKFSPILEQLGPGAFRLG